MDSIDEVIVQAARTANERDERLTEIFMEYYRLRPEDQPSAGYSAYGLLAVDVSLRLANIFLSLKRDKGLHRVVCDLTYQLMNNDFWQKNAAVIMPLIHMCLNTHTDGLQLILEREKKGEYSTYDALIASSRAAPLEIFPIIAYLVGGPELMLTVSLPLKRELAPYFLS